MVTQEGLVIMGTRKEGILICALNALGVFVCKSRLEIGTYHHLTLQILISLVLLDL